MLKVFIHNLVWGAVLDEVVKGPTAMALLECLSIQWSVWKTVSQNQWTKFPVYIVGQLLP